MNSLLPQIRRTRFVRLLPLAQPAASARGFLPSIYAFSSTLNLRRVRLELNLCAPHEVDSGEAELVVQAVIQGRCSSS